MKSNEKFTNENTTTTTNNVTTSVSNTTTTTTNQKEPLKPGEIVGIIIGVLLLIVNIYDLIIYLKNRNIKS